MPATLQIETVTVKKDGGTATAVITRRRDGAVVFNDVDGNEVIAHSNTQATKLFQALLALDT